MRRFSTAAAMLAACSAIPVPAAAKDTQLVAACRSVMEATEPARRAWLERDLFVYEMVAAGGASPSELRPYRQNLAETCGNVALNNTQIRQRAQFRAPKF